jgi:FAD/FMN-containing dehydrogenase
MDGAGVSRRTLLAGSAALTALGATRAQEALRPARTRTACAPPPNFPAGIEIHQTTYQNWAGEIRVDDAWTCRPATPADVVALANWAVANGYTLRPKGYAHGWSPLTVPADSTCATRVVLVDTTAHLTTVGLGPVVAGTPTVRAQTGASLDTVLAFLEDNGYGLTATPAPGDLSVGGALAIDAHGTAIPARGEVPRDGDSYGSLSNRVVSLTAVVWDAASGRYVLRAFDRTDPDCPVLLAHLGRAFLVEVTLRVRADYHLRCVSDLSIPTAELFAATGPRTLASFAESTGRVEAIWFPFTGNPWLKVWSISADRPVTSRPTTTPYNYPFADSVPKPVAELAGQLVSGQWYLAPVFGQAQYDAALAGLTATQSADLWGLSKNLLLYVKPTTLRMHANGYAVSTRRADIQRVVAGFVAFYRDRLQAYAAQGRYPVNGPVEIRVTGLDGPVGPAAPPALSAIRPRADHPEWDVAVWLDLLTLPTTPDAGDFYHEIEQFIFTTFPGARPEWSKGWAYTSAGAWTDRTVITGTIPATFRAGPDPTWDDALAVLDRHDPHRVFTNPFLDTLLP